MAIMWKHKYTRSISCSKRWELCLGSCGCVAMQHVSTINMQVSTVRTETIKVTFMVCHCILNVHSVKESSKIKHTLIFCINSCQEKERSNKRLVSRYYAPFCAQWQHTVFVVNALSYTFGRTHTRALGGAASATHQSCIKQLVQL